MELPSGMNRMWRALYGLREQGIEPAGAVERGEVV
jgi:hypothetical protein